MKKRIGLSVIAGCIGLLPLTVGGPASATRIDVSPEGEAAGPKMTYYNLKIRDLRLAFHGGATVRWTDNIGYGNDEDSGQVFEPTIGVDAYYPVSPYFQLSGGITVGYQHYLSGDGEDQYFVRGSEGALSASITAEILLDEDTSIQLRDTLARSVDSLDIAIRDRNEDYAAWNHSFSALYSKAINRKTTGKAQYTHQDRWTSDSEFDYLDYSSDSFDAVLLYRILKKLSIGPYFRITNTRFHEDERNNRTLYEGGLTTTGQFTLGGNVSYTFNFGYESPQIDNDNDPAAEDDDGRFVTNFNFSVRPTVFPGHRVRLGYRRNHTDPDPGVNYSDELFAGYGMDVRIVKDWLVSGDIDWVDISDSDNGEDANLWRFTLRSSYDLTKNTTVRATYRYTDKTSDVSGNEFNQNVIDVTVNYRF